METNIKQVIANWHSYKQQAEELEKKIERCKNIVKNYMDDNDANVIVSDYHIVRRSKHTRVTLDNKNIPEEILKKYRRHTEYWLYKINEK